MFTEIQIIGIHTRIQLRIPRLGLKPQQLQTPKASKTKFTWAQAWKGYMQVQSAAHDSDEVLVFKGPYAVAKVKSE